MNRHQFFEAFSKLEQQAPRRKEILQRVLRGQMCAEIAQNLGIDEGTVRKQLSNIYKEFGLTGEFPGDRRPRQADLADLFRKYKPEFIEGSSAVSSRQGETIRIEEGLTKTWIDWGEAPDVSVFYGRTNELDILERWIITDRCQLVAILGMGGIGKTGLSVKLGKGGIGKTDLSLKLARGIQDEFDYVIWRRLLNAPPLIEILADLIQFLSNQNEINLSDAVDARISRLLHYLKTHRCLLILDNAEAILQDGDRAGHYRKGYEEYGQLFRRVGEVPHQSCLLLTSREKPQEIAVLEGKTKPVRSLPLSGLDVADGKKIFTDVGDFYGLDDEWRELVEFYNGNPLVLEIVAKHIVEVFCGNISSFLREGKPVFSNLCDLLDWHFERLSGLEKEIMYWLAINREPTLLLDLREDILSVVAKREVPETIQSAILIMALTIQGSENGVR